jgi:CTP:molybdopterin cytidylyltransferase MocA
VAPKRIVVASYEGILGVPCVFPREYFDEIERLRGDVGARDILNRQRNEVIAVPMPKAQLDIDRPEDCTRIWSEATKLVDLDKGGQ